MAEVSSDGVGGARTDQIGRDDPVATSETRVEIAEPDAVWVLRLAEATAREVGDAAGFDLTADINVATNGAEDTSGAAKPRQALRLGPDEWWLRADRSSAAGIESRLGVTLGNRTHSVVNVSDRHVTFNITGPGAEALLATGTPLDVHRSAFAAGHCTRTVFARAEIVLARRPNGPDDDRFELTVNRSFARYVEALLRDALPMIWVRKPIRNGATL